MNATCDANQRIFAAEDRCNQLEGYFDAEVSGKCGILQGMKCDPPASACSEDQRIAKGTAVKECRNSSGLAAFYAQLKMIDCSCRERVRCFTLAWADLAQILLVGDSPQKTDVRLIVHSKR